MGIYETHPVYQAAQPTTKVRVQDLQPGMKVERLTVDLNFVYVPVTAVVPRRLAGRTKTYQVQVDDGLPADRPWLRNTSDKALHPFTVGLTARLDVLTESLPPVKKTRCSRCLAALEFNPVTAMWLVPGMKGTSGRWCETTPEKPVQVHVPDYDLVTEN